MNSTIIKIIAAIPGIPLLMNAVLFVVQPEKVTADLANQDYQDFEVIVAREKGIVDAMNLALVKARGNIFVRVDDDVREGIPIGRG